MDILALSVKEKYFEQILSGEKKDEFREIRPTSESKYCEMDKDGYVAYRDGKYIPRKYDAIKFLTGEYKGKRPYAIVEVKRAEIELFVDENGEFITYEHNGEECLAAQVVYGLGSVIEKHV
jgi:hypothetical protein